MDTNQWFKFEIFDTFQKMQLSYNNTMNSQKKVYNLVVPTQESVKNNYFFECMLTAMKPCLVVGRNATGKSSLVRDTLFNQIYCFTKDACTEHVPCSYRTNASSLKEFIEHNFKTCKTQEEKMLFGDSDNEMLPAQEPPNSKDTVENEEQEEVKVTIPAPKNKSQTIIRPDGNKLIVYIEDIHLSSYDQFKDNSTVEALREIISEKLWYSSKKKSLRRIEDVNIVCCMTSENSEFVSRRLLRHFLPIGLENLNQEIAQTVFSQIFSMQANQWPSVMQQQIPKLANAVFDLCSRCFTYLRPTPIKVHYAINQQDMFRLTKNICKVEGSYLNNVNNLVKLFFHEAVRQFGDMILMRHDLQWFNQEITEMCKKHFDVDIQQDDLWFSVLNEEVEGLYLELKSIDQIDKLAQGWIDKYNEQMEVRKINLVLYQSFNQHLIKILRGISVQDGHMIVVGLKGFGISSMIKLASFIMNAKYSQIEMYPDFGDQEWLQEVRQRVVKAAQDDVQVVWQIDEHRIVDQNWYKDLESLMKSGQMVNCLSRKDIIEIMTTIMIQKKRFEREVQYGVSSGGQNKTPAPEKDNQTHQSSVGFINMQAVIEAKKKELHQNFKDYAEYYSYFVQRLRKNLHLVMNFSPTGQEFRQKLVRNQSLMLNSQIVWINELNNDDLLHIGRVTFIEKIHTEQVAKTTQDVTRDQRYDEYDQEYRNVQNIKVLKTLVQMYMISQKITKIYLKDQQHSVFLTPVHYLRSFNTFSRLLSEREQNVKGIKQRYEQGITKIKSTIKSIEDYQVVLEQQIPDLIEQQKHQLSLMVDIEEEYQRVDIQREQEVEHCEQLQEITNQAQQVLQDCQSALDKIIPCLNETMHNMLEIDKQELAEIKSLANPPKMVKKVMKALCTVLDIEPVLKKKEDGTFKPDYWIVSIGHKLLGNPQLPEILSNFESQSINEEKIQKIEEVFSDPDFTYERAIHALQAVGTIFKWIKNVRDYYYVFNELEPRREAVVQAEQDYNKKLKELQDKQTMIQGLVEHLVTLKDHQNDKSKLVQGLRDEIELRTSLKKKAEHLQRSLNQEKQKWLVCSRMLDTKYSTVSGDVVLAAAYITYCGAFTQKYRKILVDQWQDQALRQNQLAYSYNFQLQELFGDNFKTREWHDNNLPQDSICTDNALIMDKTRQFCLCIDPQNQALAWLEKQYESVDAQQTRQDDPNFRRVLEVAVDMGKVVIVRHCPETVDVHIESLIRQEKIRYGDQIMLKYCRRQLKLEPTFNLILVTNVGKPCFDVNITNHVSLVNFFVTKEGLTQNLLNLIISNERQELQQTYKTTSQATFDDIKILKATENVIVQHLNNQDAELTLEDATLFESLNKSRDTAETIANNLRILNSTNEFIEKSKLQYAPVAYRASSLFFAITQLYKINPLYHFSMSWFMNLFKMSLNRANMLNLKGRNTLNVEDEEFKLLNTKFTLDDRIELLVTSFTQEVIKRVTFSVFQHDRQLITYYLSLKVLQAEKLTNDELIAFSLCGAKEYQNQTSQKSGLSWISDVMWQELLFLSKLKPFNEENLVQHIRQNNNDWNKLQSATKISFQDLPNKKLIDFTQFKIEDFLQLPEQNKQQNLRDSTNSMEINKFQDDQSATSVKKLTEQQALDDQEIWRIDTEQDDEYDARKRNKQYYDDLQRLEQEEEQMALYLIESAPRKVSVQQNQEDITRQTKQERKALKLRQQVLTHTFELAILRCIRPDLINQCFHSLVSTVYDFEYNSFEGNILSKFIDATGTLDLRRHKQKQAHVDPDKYVTSVTMPGQKIKENNFQLLIKDAFEESDCQTPIVLFISHSVSVYQEIQEFHFQQSQKQGAQIIKLYNYLCGKIQKDQIFQALKKSQSSGDWLLLEGIHLEKQFMVELEQQITRFNKDNCHTRFRLFLSMSQVDFCPESLLMNSIKVALQQPVSIKMKFEKKIEQLNKEGWFKRAASTNQNFQKNLYFALSYLHSILDGRSQYGTVGWNKYKSFDRNDFDISAEMLGAITKKEIKDQSSKLQQLKYIFSKIFFVGKITNFEDERKLMAHVNDLFNQQLSFCNEAPADINKSHYGFPAPFADFMQWVNQFIPKNEDFEIYGIDINIQRQKLIDVSVSVIDQLRYLSHQTLVDLQYADQQNDMQISAYRSNQQQTQSQMKQVLESFFEIQKLLKYSSLDGGINLDQDRYDERVGKKLLQERDKVDQKIAQKSHDIISAIESVIQPSDIEIFQFKDPVEFVVRKEIEAVYNLTKCVTNTIRDLLMHVEGSLPIPFEMEYLWQRIQDNQVPQTWLLLSAPTSHKRLTEYLINFFEKLCYWQGVIQNFKQSGQLSSFHDITHFCDPNQFLYAQLQRRARACGISTRKVYNTFSVMEGLVPEDVINEQNVVDQLKQNPFQTVLYGLWLENAEWDLFDETLVESTGLSSKTRFPMVCVDTQESDLLDLELAANDEENFDDNPEPALQEKQLKDGQILQGQLAELANAEKEKFAGGRRMTLRKLKEKANDQKVYIYRCPVYACSLRLSQSVGDKAETPVFYVNLRTFENPRKWIKRSVALLMEATN